MNPCCCLCTRYIIICRNITVGSNFKYIVGPTYTSRYMWSWLKRKDTKFHLLVKYEKWLSFALMIGFHLLSAAAEDLVFVCQQIGMHISLTRQLTYPSIDNNQHNLLMHTMMEWWMIPYHLTWNGPLVWKSVKKNCLLQSDRVRNMKMY